MGVNGFVTPLDKIHLVWKKCFVLKEMVQFWRGFFRRGLGKYLLISLHPTYKNYPRFHRNWISSNITRMLLKLKALTISLCWFNNWMRSCLPVELQLGDMLFWTPGLRRMEDSNCANAISWALIQVGWSHLFSMWTYLMRRQPLTGPAQTSPAGEMLFVIATIRNVQSDSLQMWSTQSNIFHFLPIPSGQNNTAGK